MCICKFYYPVHLQVLEGGIIIGEPYGTLLSLPTYLGEYCFEIYSTKGWFGREQPCMPIVFIVCNIIVCQINVKTTQY